MGSEKTTTDTSSQQQQTQKSTPTAQEQRMLDKYESVFNASVPGQEELAKIIPDTIKGILSGGTGLPKVFSDLFAGITPELTNEMASQAVGDLQPGFGKQGILDSGTAASVAGRTAGDIRRNVAENNLNRVYSLLGLGLGEGLQSQASGATSYGNPLLGSLQGLRTTTGTGSMTGQSTVTSMNPFLKSFQTSAGTQLGGGLGKFGSSYLTGGTTL
jgi:hypothetical protein